MTLATRRAAVLGLFAAGAAPWPATGPARAAEPIQLGAYPSNPPYEFKDETGRFRGFEIDLMTAVAARMGRPLQITDMQFQALFVATAAGRLDMAVSCITILPARLQNQDFTQPYLDNSLALIAGPTSRVHSLEDLKGTTMGALASSIGEAWLKENAARYGVADTRSYDTAAAMFLDTANGRVDATANDRAGSLYAFRSMKGMRVVTSLSGTNGVGIMLPRNSPLTVPVNAIIDGLKQDGTLATLFTTWFGVAPPPESSTMRVLPLPHRA